MLTCGRKKIFIKSQTLSQNSKKNSNIITKVLNSTPQKKKKRKENFPNKNQINLCNMLGITTKIK